MLIVRRISSNDLFRQYMKFNDYYNTISEAKRKKEPESNVQLPDGTWRRVDSYGDVYYSKTKNESDYHRMDGPAIDYADGGKEWWVNNKRHRLDGPAIEWIDGSNLWYVNGKLHRSDGPAVEYADGSKQWWVNGERHRLDGPAVEYENGRKWWWVNNKQYSEKVYHDVVQVITAKSRTDQSNILMKHF